MFARYFKITLAAVYRMKWLLPEALLIVLIIIKNVESITFENNGYKNVIVAIHPDVPEDNGPEIIDNIKVIIDTL